VGRFAHAHEYHLAHRAAFAREHHLGDDLGAAELAQQAVAAAHAEHTAHGTTHLRRNAQAAARQQHALHHLAVTQFHQQPCDAFVIGKSAQRHVGGIFIAQPRQSMQLRLDGGQLIAQRKRKESLCGTVLPVVRADLTPAAQQAIFVARLGTEIAQALAKLGDTHREVRSGNQSGFESNCGEAVRILTQALIRYAARARWQDCVFAGWLSLVLTCSPTINQ
jgi:hypothetical protein